MTDVESGQDLICFVCEHGFSLENGWMRQSIDLEHLFQSFANWYLFIKSNVGVTADLVNATNMLSLTFCPNILFLHFPHTFNCQPCSQSFQSAVLLADISGFSKFAGEMCLRGAKGLDVLHKVTSDFLGHFVKTVYEYDGDGEDAHNLLHHQRINIFLFAFLLSCFLFSLSFSLTLCLTLSLCFVFLGLQ